MIEEIWNISAKANVAASEGQAKRNFWRWKNTDDESDLYTTNQNDRPTWGSNPRP